MSLREIKSFDKWEVVFERLLCGWLRKVGIDEE